MPPLTSSFDLLHAIDSDQLVLHYQPVIDLRSGQIETREALVRWQHPELDLLSPAAFMELAENRWLGCELTNWVLKRAFTDCADWQARGQPSGVSVNVLPELLDDYWLLDVLRNHLLATGLAPSAVTLEVTERRWPSDEEAAYRALEAVKSLGVRISLDDFGTGDSSLSRLRRVHFHELKIDRSFIVEAVDDETARHIVAFTSRLAKTLGTRTVAEGVQRSADLRVAHELEVDAAQGFLLGRPTPLSA